MTRFLTTLLILVLAICSMNAQEAQSPEDAGKELRKLILNTKPSEIGLASDPEFPHVYGVVTDWGFGEPHIATIVALRDGTASLYTTSTFGIIGGQGHDTVRNAAIESVKVAERFFSASSKVEEYRYPHKGEILFYLLTYDGVRVCSAPEEKVYSERHVMTPLFAAVQDVLTQLRIVTGRN